MIYSTNVTTCRIVVSQWSKKQTYIEKPFVISFNTELLTTFLTTVNCVVKKRTSKSAYYIRFYCELLSGEEEYIWIRKTSKFAPTIIKSFIDLLHSSNIVSSCDGDFTCEGESVQTYIDNENYVIKRLSNYREICLRKQNPEQMTNVSKNDIEQEPTVVSKPYIDTSAVIENYSILSHSYSDLFTYCVGKDIINKSDDLDDMDDMENFGLFGYCSVEEAEFMLHANGINDPSVVGSICESCKQH